MNSVVARKPDIFSGTPVFAGTPVPVNNLTDYLKDGSTIDDFPTVNRQQIIVFLGVHHDSHTTPDPAGRSADRDVSWHRPE